MWSFSDPHPLRRTGNIGDAIPSMSTPASSTLDDFTHPSPAPEKESQAQPTSKPLGGVPNSDTWVRKVTDINLKLLQHAASIQGFCYASGRGSHQGQDYSRFAVNGMGFASDQEGFAIDTTFRLSRELVAILGDILAPENQNHHQSAPQNKMAQSMPPNNGSETGHSRHNSLIGAEQRNGSNSTAAFLDPGSMLLVLSCYIRILDIYSKFFSLVATSLTAPLQESNRIKDLAKLILLPDLVIGNFSLHSSPSLQFTLIISIIEEVLERLRSSVGQFDLGAGLKSSRWGKAEEDAEESLMSDFQGVSEVTLQAIRVREAKITKRMNELRRRLQASGGV